MASDDERNALIQKFVDENSHFFTKQKHFVKTFVKNYKIVDDNRTRVAMQTYNNDNSANYAKPTLLLDPSVTNIDEEHFCNLSHDHICKIEKIKDQTHRPKNVISN